MLGISSIIRNKVRVITFCNTKKRNALSAEAYNAIANILNTDAKDDKIIATILTGKDDYFTSGNDLAIKMDENFDFEEASKSFHQRFVRMVDAFINYPKLVVAVVNGPAIGIGFTITGLSDVVYASDTATFSAPFVKLGLCIEGCASYMMPRILGKSMANEVLLLGRKLTVHEAVQYNLVSKVIPKPQVASFIDNLVKDLSDLPMEPIIYNKKLVNDNLRDALVACAKREADVLSQCQRSEFFLTNAMNFMNRKSKL